MNRTSLVLTAFAVSVSGVYAQITNIVGTGTETVSLTGYNFSGSVGEIAGTVSSLAIFNSTNTTYQGGVGESSGLIGNGAFGLSVQDVGETTIDNSSGLIRGGDGGSGTSTVGGNFTATAKGGVGFAVNSLSAPDYGGPDGDVVNVNRADIEGGAGGVVIGTQANILDASGGAAMSAENVWINLKSVNLLGGRGGTVISDGAYATAKGGDGLLTGYDTMILELDETVTAVGGAGGVINSSAGGLSADASGGMGFNHQSLNYFDADLVMEISGGHYEGGTGGAVTAQEGIDVDGGIGFYFNFQQTHISGGEFVGGMGGVAVSTSNEMGSANGADGLYAFGSSSLVIDGGTFVGGAAGTVNGVLGDAGASLHLTDSFVTINDGSFEDDVWVESLASSGAGSTLDITGGRFGNMHFTTAAGLINTTDISGGTFENVQLDGSGQNDATMSDVDFGDFTFSGTGTNNVALNNATIGSIYFNESTINSLSLADVSSSGRVVLTGGVSTFTSWSDSNFTDIYITNGTMNLRNGAYTQSADSSLVLAGDSAFIDFDQDVVINGSLDVGLGSLHSAENITFKSDAQLISSVTSDGTGGVTAGAITGADLVFEDGVYWGLTFGANISTNENLLTNGIVLASATGALSNEMDVADISIVANNPNWLKGITDLTNVNETLIASYGDVAFTSVFENDDPEFQKAMTDLGMSVDNNPELREYLGAAWDDLESASATLEQGYTRTPEMASAMIGLQGVFADQIKDRTRSHLRFKKFGSTTSYSPSGSQGPSDWYDNTVQWANDHAPKWDFREAQRHASDNVAGDEYAALQDSLRSRTPGISSESIDVPETYQVWGRGYGSHVSQDATTGHVGYDASIGGGVLGVDKRFEKVLVGVGVGYAYTRVEGNAGNDGDADTLHAMAYFSRCSENLYFDASINYAFNDISTESVSALGYEADYNANTLGFAVGTGYGISFFKDKWLFTPEASYLGVLYDRGSYTEKSNEETSLPNKDYDSYNEWSHQTAVGVTLSMVGVIESFNTELEFQPELRVHWLHEFNTDLDDDSYVMAGGVGDSISVALQAREEDLIRLGAGIRFSEWGNETTEFGLDIDGAFADDYHNVVLSGKFMHRF